MELSDNSVSVLYIMGSGRSGSTILDTILGNHSNIESIGEMINLPAYGWGMNGYCACGRRANECAFWIAVRNEWKKINEDVDLHEYVTLQDNMNKLWKRFRKFEKPDRFSSDFEKYSRLTLALYKAIQNISGKSVIVDSSKSPLRAYFLSLIAGIDLKLIHLVRDPRGVAWSQKKSFIKNEENGVLMDYKSTPLWRSAINWDRINLRSDWVRNQIEQRCTLRVFYEDILRDSKKVLSNIGCLINVEMQEIEAKIDNGHEFLVGHTISGNRMRMSGNVRLKIDEEWRQQLTMFEQSVIWLISGYLLNRYNKLDKGRDVVGR